MSRQAISKWESGSSYPDMEKMMEICKVLDCTLEDLLDDGTIKGQITDKKTDVNEVFKSFLGVITRSYNMFWSMSFKDKLKFVFEMTFIAISLYLIFSFIGTFFTNVTYPVIRYLPNAVYSIVRYIYTLAASVMGVILFFHLYKIRYLDYYITIEDEDVAAKTVEEPIKENKNIKEGKDGRLIYEKKKEKVIIRDPKHSGHSFINLLASAFIVILKTLSAIFVFPLIFLFVLLTALLTFALASSSTGTLMLTMALAIIGALLLAYIVLEVMMRLLFNKEFNMKRLFIMFVVSLALMGIGSGLSAAELATYDVKELREANGGQIVEINTVIDFEENLIIPMLRYDENKVVIDNNEQNLVITTSCPKIYKCKVAAENQMLENSDYLTDEQVQVETYKYVYLSYRSDHRFKDYYDLLNTGLKNKIIYINSNSPVTSEIKVSSVNYDKLLANIEKQ